MKQSSRLLSLDAFRGAAIAMMFVVGSKSPFEQFRHIDWFGYTVADLVYPFFLFVVGFAMVLSTHKQDEGGVSKTEQRNGMFKRLCYLFIVGCFLRSVSYSRIYINLGTLQCIALCSLVGYFFIRSSNAHRVVAISAAYAIVCLLHSVGCEPQALSLFCWSEGSTTGEMIDVLVLGKHKAAEGLVGTFSYATNVIWGQIAASVYLENGVSKRCLTRYAAVGFCVLAIGWCLSNKAILGSFLFFPLSPQIATPSFNLTAAGWAMLVFGALLLIIDHLKLSTWAKPFVVLGANPITVYVLVKLIDKWIYKTWTLSIGEQSYTFKAAAEYLVTSFAGLHYAQLGPVALKLITAWTIATVLWRNKLFIKL